MIKNFEKYTKEQRLGNRTQWKKDYDNGGVAYIMIDNTGLTRKKVRAAFEQQEYEQKHKDEIEHEKNWGITWR